MTQILLFLLAFATAALPGTTVAGRVVDAAGRPVFGAEVSLRRSGLPDEGASSLHATTGRDGRFVFSRLDPGMVDPAVDLKVRAAGFRPLPVPAVRVPQGRTIDLGPIALTRGVAVSVAVTDPGGRPVAGAKVWEERRELALSWAANAEVEPEETSGPDGFFTLAADPRGGSCVVRHPGYRVGRLAWTGIPDAPLTLVLHPKGHAAGRVLAPDGTPVAGAEVSLSRAGLSAPGGSGRTDAEGRFSVATEGPGWYALSATAAGYLPAELSAPLHLPEGAEVAGIELRLQEGATLAGRVTSSAGEPVAGAHVAAWSERAGVVTDGAGRYLLRGEPPGETTVRVWVDEEGISRVQEIPFAIRPGDNRLDLTLDRKPRHTVAGRVLGPDGAPAAGAVLGTNEHGDLPASSAADGTFSFTLQDGTYKVFAVTEGPNGASGEIAVAVAGADVSGLEIRLGGAGRIVGRVLGLDAGELAQVQITLFEDWTDAGRYPTYPDRTGAYRIGPLDPGGYPVTARLGARRIDTTAKVAAGADTVFDLTFPPRFEIRGRVTDKDGAPLAGADVDLSRGDGRPAADHVATGGDGAYAVPVLAGTYVVSVAKPGFAPAGDRSVTVAGGDVDGVDFALDRGATLRGRVLGMAPGDPVQLKAEGPGVTATAEVADDGSYRIAAATAGEWKVTATMPGQGYGEVVSAVTRSVAVPAGPGEAVLDLPLDLGRTALDVHLRGDDPVQLVRLFPRSGTAPPRWMMTGYNGCARFRYLHPGAYRLEIGGGDSSIVREIEVPAGGEVAELEIDLPEGKK